MSENINRQNDSSYKEILRQIKWVIRLRLFAVGSFFSAALLYWLFFPYEFLPVVGIALFVSAYNFAAWRHYQYYSQSNLPLKEKMVQINFQVSLILDILVIGWSIHLSGGAQSVLLPFYMIHIPLLGYAISRRMLVGHVSLIAVILALVFGLEFYGILPHRDIEPLLNAYLYRNLQFIARRWIFLIMFLFLGAYISDYLRRKFQHLLLSEQKALQQSESLKKVAVSLGSTLEWKETLDVILNSINTLTPFDSAVIILEGDRDATIIAGRGIPQDYINTIIPLEEWVHLKALLNQEKSRMTQPINSSISFWNRIELPNIRSSLLAPMVLPSAAQGVIFIGSKMPAVYNKEDASLVQSLAYYAALSLKNSQLYENTRRQALTDGLTGLKNIRSLYDDLEQEVVRSKRYEQKFSVLMCDLDNFKRYNDLYGHLTGDDLLRDLAMLMTSVARRSDKIFRYGGEEFTLILPETDWEQALILAERLREAVEEYNFILRNSGESSHITISLGLSVFPDDADTPKTLLEKADKALYKAKENRNKVSWIQVVSATG
ncbi:MAG: sensor domain-containing diguanylate cyclase [Anaerolineae bacterium]|nr:sensor domain-containing diguanylate cyclase [Anaerolineae bacterium]